MHTPQLQGQEVVPQSCARNTPEQRFLPIEAKDDGLQNQGHETFKAKFGASRVQLLKYKRQALHDGFEKTSLPAPTGRPCQAILGEA